MFSKDGISPDTSKVDAIKSLKQPENVKQLRSFLGMVNYSGRFINNLAKETEPLRRLLKVKKWIWTDQQESAFKKIKPLLSSNALLSYFNPQHKTKLIVDASPQGLGAILV